MARGRGRLSEGIVPYSVGGAPENGRRDPLKRAMRHYSPGGAPTTLILEPSRHRGSARRGAMAIAAGHQRRCPGEAVAGALPPPRKTTAGAKTTTRPPESSVSP